MRLRDLNFWPTQLVRRPDGKGRRKTDLSKEELRELRARKPGGPLAIAPSRGTYNAGARLEDLDTPSGEPILDGPGSTTAALLEAELDELTISDREYDPEWIYFEAGGRMIPWYGSRTNELRLHDSRDFTVREWDYVEHLSCRLSPYGQVVFTGRLRVARPNVISIDQMRGPAEITE